MKLKECKEKRCGYLDRKYNDSCKQFNGAFYCGATPDRCFIKYLGKCPKDE